eukprot:TRINITY_DN473_c0_g2_i1.p1 TRINITY_DN473_c0_g2~~TRINITY_DN473_c0_g2_i1.p1  ORF type:complete len:329 (-),score=34.39 TRINITY_DN473_c0_g2_i1:357-1343(-)
MMSIVPSTPTNFVLAGMWLAWLSFTVYVFGMPLWSKIFLDDLGYWKELCVTPAEDIVCGDGQDYMEIATRLGRVHHYGTHVGCGHGAGIFGDWACPVNLAVEPVSARTFSISYLMGTPNATGLLAAVAFLPLLSIWGYGFWTNPAMAAAVRANGMLRQGLNESRAFSFLFYTQVAFQLLLAAFLFFTFCSFVKGHEVFMELFTLSQTVHFFGIAYVLDCRSFRAKIIIGLMIGATLALLLGVQSSRFGQRAVGHAVYVYGFWFAECVVFSTYLIITPLICLLARDTDHHILVVVDGGLAVDVPLPSISSTTVEDLEINCSALLAEVKR